MTNEARRIEALHACAILDTAPHPYFDSLTRAAALALRTPIALISLIDTDRQWFKSAMGVAIRETPRSISFCSHTIEGFEPMVVEDTWLDSRFADNPLVAGKPYIRFYAGAPLIDPEGFALGTLCVLDYSPRRLGLDQVRLLGHLADAVMYAVSAHSQSLELRRMARKLEAMHQIDEDADRVRAAG